MKGHKLLIVAEMRDLEKQVSKGEISYSRMIEIINEKHSAVLSDELDKVEYWQNRCWAAEDRINNIADSLKKSINNHDRLKSKEHLFL